MIYLESMGRRSGEGRALMVARVLFPMLIYGATRSPL